MLSPAGGNVRSSPVSSVLSHHDDECVTYPSFAPTVFICHHIQGSELSTGHGQTLQHQIRDGCHFGSPERQRERKIQAAGDYCSLLKMKDNFSIDRSQVWQNQLLKMHSFYVLCRASPPPRVPSTLERRKKFTSRAFEYLLCGPGKCLGFRRWKHWRVHICIVSLEGVVVSLLAVLSHTPPGAGLRYP